MSLDSQANGSGDPFNAVNRGVYIADNLPFLRGLNDECIDLVNIDPPFAKNDTFIKSDDELKPPLTDAERLNEQRLLESWNIYDAKSADAKGIAHPDIVKAGFRDIWSWANDIHEEWLNSIEDGYAGVAKLIDTTRYVHSDSVAAYLCYMAIRLIELHRVLKPEGSLYLHCDHTANGYLRQLLDSIFGIGNFRNEIVWAYPASPSAARRDFPRKHDTIYRYTKSSEAWTFNADAVRVEYAESSKKRVRYAANASTVMGGTEIKLRAGGKIPPSVWSDIQQAYRYRHEITGYGTQKPVKLAERIIQASSNEGDVVLDCFAGCAYTALAAERLNRRWIACDINPRAWTIFKRQFNKPQLVRLKCHDATTGQQVMSSEPVVTVHGPDQLPERVTPVSDIQPEAFELPKIKFKVPASVIPEPDMLRELLEISGYQAWCCGFANRKPNGEIIRTTRNFHLDHIDPKSKEGTSNDIVNRAPLCPYHNIKKGNERIGLAEYRVKIADAKELMVDKFGDLQDLNEARHKANVIFAREFARTQGL